MKNIAQVFIFDLTAKALSALAFFLIIRVMPETEYATYVFAISVLTLALGTVSGTLNRIYIIGHDRFNLQEITADFLVLQLVLLTIGAIVLLPFVKMPAVLYVSVFCLIATNYCAEYTKTVFQQRLRFLRYSLIDTVENLLFAVGLGIMSFAKTSLTANSVIVVQTAITFITFISLGRVTVTLRNSLNFSKIFALLRQIVHSSYRYLILYFFILSFFSQLDVFMLKMLSSVHNLAAYGSAFRYYTLVVLFLYSLHAVILPLVYHAQTRADLQQIYKKHLQMLILVIPVILIGAYAAQWFVPLIDGGKYPEAVAVFRILSLSAIVSIAFSPYVNLSFRVEDFGFLFVLVIFATLLAIGLDFIVAPVYGALGVAVITFISSAVINITIFARSLTYFSRPELLTNGAS